MKKVLLATLAATVTLAGAAQAHDYSMSSTTVYNDLSPYAGPGVVYVDDNDMVVYRSYRELHPVYYRDYSGGDYDWTYWRQTTPAPDARRNQYRNTKQH